MKTRGCFTENAILDYKFWNLITIEIDKYHKSFNLFLEGDLIGCITTYYDKRDWNFKRLVIKDDYETMFCLDEMFVYLKQIIINRGICTGMDELYNSFLEAK